MPQLLKAMGHGLALAQRWAVHPLDSGRYGIRQGRVDDALLAALGV